MKRRIWFALVCAVVAVMIPATAILAYSYSWTLTLTNSSASTLAHYPVIIPMDNATNIELGYMGQDGLDTRVLDGATELPYLIADDRTLVVTDVNARTSKNLKLTVGNQPDTEPSSIFGTSMPIIVGNGGKVILPDNEDFEMTNSDEITVSMWVYVNTAVSDTIWHKGDTLSLRNEGSTLVAALDDGVSQYESTAAVVNDGVPHEYAVTLSSVNTGGGVTGAVNNTVAGSIQRWSNGGDKYAQTFTAPENYAFGGVSLRLSVTGTPSDLWVILKATDGSGYPTGSALSSTNVGYEDVTTNTDGEYYDLTMSPVALTEGTLYALEFWSNTWSPTNSWNFYLTSNRYADGKCLMHSGAWMDTGGDINFSEHEMEGESPFILSISVDGNTPVDPETAAVLPDTADNWEFMGASTPYCNRIDFISGTDIVFYEPVDVIHAGTIGEIEGGYLPDRSGFGHDGLIVWGANPGTLTTSVGAFTPGNTAKLVDPKDTGGGEDLGIPVMPPTMYTEGDTSLFPGGEVIDQLLAQGDVPKMLWWYPFIFIGVVIIGMLIYEATQATGGEGSLLTMSIVMEACFILFGILGSTTGQGVKLSLIPLFPSFVFPVPCSALILSRRHVGWG